MIFRRALVRLTLMYTLAQLLLFGVFALGVYAFVTGAFDFDAGELEGDPSVATAEQGFANLRMGLVAGYAILVVVLPFASYVMARTALAPVRRSYELQQRFVDGASHEFRTPLSVIHGELELALTRSRTPAQYRLAITKALVAASSMTRLTNDLLLLTRESADELEATFEPVALNELVAEAIRPHAAERAGMSVHLTEPVIVLGSPELLARAIANILDNAIKFTSSVDRIHVEVSVTGRTARVIVQDEGIGMTDSEVTHAFDRFWRAHEARTTPGFGLGLSLVRQILTAHHGTVSIASTAGSGSTVTLSLPEYQP